MRYPHEPAVVDELGTLRFSELHERTNAIADVLARRRIRAGDRVALMCRNHRGFIEGFTALSKLGVDVVLLNTAFAGPQCAEVIEREGAKMLIHDQEFAALDPTGGRDVPRVIAWRDEGDTAEGPTLDELAAEGSRADREPPSEKGRAIILTSGTTGAPKGAARPHPPTTSATDAIATVIDAIPLRVRERTLIAAPLFHSWGLAHLTLAHSL